MTKPEETVPEGELFSIALCFTRTEMTAAHDFERLVNARLIGVKQQIMQVYRDQRPPPFEIPAEEER